MSIVRVVPNEEMLRAWAESADNMALSEKAKELRRKGESYFLNCHFSFPVAALEPSGCPALAFCAINTSGLMMVGLEDMAIIPKAEYHRLMALDVDEDNDHDEEPDPSRGLPDTLEEMRGER